MTKKLLPIAAVMHAGSGEGDMLFREFILELQNQGWKVRGLMTTQSKDPLGILPMKVCDLNTQQEFIISQNLGKGSMSCILDTGNLSEASLVLQKALQDEPDLVVVNRFGTMEVQGQGLAKEMLDLMSSGIPLITLVSHKYLENWRYFTGGLAKELPLDKQSLHNWFAEVINE